MFTNAWSFSVPRLALALGIVAACLNGCSEYPDPFTGICPEIDKLKLSAITDTSVTVSWRSDNLTKALLVFSTPRIPDLIFRGREKTDVHEVTITGLLPNSPYTMTLQKDSGGEGEDEDRLNTCGDVVEMTFQTRPVRSGLPPGTDPLLDPTEPIVP